MKKNRHNAGFTMVELLTVVAILVILMGVSAVAVIRYQRNLHLKEMDSIAKEIFVAAQNHLSAADSQNLLADYATQDNGSGLGYADDDGDTNYIICTGGQVPGGSALSLILPFGSIDETTRSNGSFILRYNKKSARVLDVFYATKSGSRYGHSLRTSDYTELMKEEYHGDTSNQREKRKRYSKNGARNAVVGWYGGDDLGTTVETYLAEPVIQVDNGDKLTVTVTNFAALTGKTLSTDSSLCLIVSGKSSGVMKQIPVAAGTSANTSVMQSGVAILSKPEDGIYVVTLDDVTASGGQFGSVMQNTTFGTSTGTFIPGEDIEVWAVAYDNGTLSNIAESGRVIVNSLFDEVKGLRVGTAASGENGDQNPTQNTPPPLPTPQAAETEPPAQHATISSFRHLLNLDSSVSRLDLDNLKTQKSLDNNDRMAAVQVSDLDWSKFMGDSSQVQIYKGTTPVTDAGYYLPVNPSKKTNETANADIPLQYWGNGHSISGVAAKNINGTTEAGLFQKMIDLGAINSRVENLNLINFHISGSGSVGALAGTLTGSITNVAAYNDITGLTVTNDSAFAISSTGGSAGGLVGEFSGGTASGCAAAVYVSGGTSAGGLIGTVTSGTVENSYSGGHTEKGRYKLNESKVEKNNKVIGYTYTVVTDGDAHLNIQGSTTGGLIGTLSVGTVTDCYSTCSVGGTTAGGFVGSAANGTTISNSYCTGLVTVKNGSSYEMFSEQTGVNIGTFAGSSSATLTNNHYLDIVNHRNAVPVKEGSTIIKFEPAKDEDQMKETGNGTAGGVSAIDESADSYNGFIDAPDATVSASPYDAMLKADTKGHLSYVKAVQEGEVTTNVPQYGFKGIKVPDTDGKEVPLLHHGDWPIYETMVINS